MTVSMFGLNMAIVQQQGGFVRYAKLHSMSLAEAFKRALFERIEDEYDIAVAGEAYQEYLANPKTYTHEEVKGLLGL